MLAVLILILRRHLLYIEFQCGDRDTLKVEFFQELFVNFMRVDLVKWHGEFKAVVHAQLELPSSLNDSLLVLLDLTLVLDNLSGIGNLFECIPIPPVEEENA